MSVKSVCRNFMWGCTNVKILAHILIIIFMLLWLKIDKWPILNVVNLNFWCILILCCGCYLCYWEVKFNWTSSTTGLREREEEEEGAATGHCSISAFISICKTYWPQWHILPLRDWVCAVNFMHQCLSVFLFLQCNVDKAILDLCTVWIS